MFSSSEHHRTAATMTETEALEKKQHRSKNGDVRPEATREDEFDHTYREKEGPKPAKIIVWKNIILMTVLHFSALYAIFLIPSASAATLLWCEYEKLPVISAQFVHSFFFIFFLINNTRTCVVLLCQ